LSVLSLELGPEIANFKCECCGELFKSVCGFIEKDDSAYSVYFATLHNGHREIAANLTISVGNWWDDNAADERSWIYVTVVPTADDFAMTVGEPSESRHHGYKALGKALSRDDALQSPLKEDFFEVADYIVVNDPAIHSYLLGEEINIRGRVCKH